MEITEVTALLSFPEKRGCIKQALASSLCQGRRGLHI